MKRISLIFVALFMACAGTQPAPAIAPPKATPAPPSKPALPPPAAPRADPSLLSRKVLFGNPDRARPLLSPDGKQLSFLAPVDGVLNLWVGPADDPGQAKPVTHEMKRGVRQHLWAYTSRHVLYLQDKDGDENWHVFAVDLGSGAIKDLTPYAGVQARVQQVSPKFPDEILLLLNSRDAKHHDAWRVNIRTGASKLVLQNEAGFAEFVADDDYRVRLGMRLRPDGGADYLDPEKKDAKPWMEVGPDDMLTTGPEGYDASGKTLYLRDSRGRDTAALFAQDTKSGRSTLIFEDPKADFADQLSDPRTKRVQAAAANWDRKRWKVIDKAVAADLAALGKVADGDVEVLDRSLDDKRWVVAFVVSDGPVRYYRWDRAGNKSRATFLFTNNTALEKASLSKMVPVVVKARDGLELVSYLTLPRAADPDGDGRPAAPLPLVLDVHGGPWARDQWGLNPWHQWYASRGYAALSVNYRGSTGFGKGFVNAGNREWAGRMHDDLLDAVDWAVAQKIADPQKIAIMGGSYGGYATLVGLTFSPERFACGVDIVGPSNLMTLLSTIPPYWAPLFELFATRVGDPRTDEGKKLLAERSPLTHVDRIARPLLIGQGKNDPRVKQAESDQIVAAMNTKGIPVTYVLYADEGHGFARPENRMSFNAVAEVFLAQCLGGPYQPVGDDFSGSTIAVPAGADRVWGLAQALPAK
jgi:dipeptidyl aminopeptidase/acylaminoacyl peptidase